MILQEMENKSSVTVSLNDIKGIFVKPPEMNPIYFMYSNHTKFNVSIKKSISSNIYILLDC